MFDVLKADDPQFAEKSAQRFAAQDDWNDVFATKLIEILDKQDDFQARIRGQLMSAAELERLRSDIEKADGALAECGQTAAKVAASGAGLEQAQRAAACARLKSEEADRQAVLAQSRLDAAARELGAAKAKLASAREACEGEAREARSAAAHWRKAEAELAQAVGALDQARAILAQAKAEAARATAALGQAAAALKRARIWLLRCTGLAAVACLSPLAALSPWVRLHPWLYGLAGCFIGAAAWLGTLQALRRSA